MTDGAAVGNISVELTPAREHLLEGAFAQQVAGDLLERFTGIENVSVGIDTREHGGETLEVTEFQLRAQHLGSAVNGLLSFAAAFDDLLHQDLVSGVLLQA